MRALMAFASCPSAGPADQFCLMKHQMLIHHHHGDHNPAELPIRQPQDSEEVKIHGLPRSSGFVSGSGPALMSAEWVQDEARQMLRGAVRHRHAISTLSLLFLGFLLGVVWEGGRVLPTPALEPSVSVGSG